MARAPKELRWDDPQRDRAKAGDTFIAEDGTRYLIEASPYTMLDGTPVVGVGLPIAMDLGRSFSWKDHTETVKDGRQKTSMGEFGWVNSKVHTCRERYTVNPRTGEGHYASEWNAIAKGTKPTEPGVEGQYSEDQNWVFRYGCWDWAVD